MCTAIYRGIWTRTGGVVALAVLFCMISFMSGCGSKDAGPSFGQSFNVIKGVSGNSYRLDGYSSYVESRSGAFAPDAVLIVGVKEGVDFDGTHFDLGAIILVEGPSTAPTSRLATPDDYIVATRDVTVFGRKYKKGRFTVPTGGKLIPTDI